MAHLDVDEMLMSKYVLVCTGGILVSGAGCFEEGSEITDCRLGEVLQEFRLMD